MLVKGGGWEGVSVSMSGGHWPCCRWELFLWRELSVLMECSLISTVGLVPKINVCGSALLQNET